MSHKIFSPGKVGILLAALLNCYETVFPYDSGRIGVSSTVVV
jgi:hypothetical protein